MRRKKILYKGIFSFTDELNLKRNKMKQQLIINLITNSVIRQSCNYYLIDGRLSNYCYDDLVNIYLLINTGVR